uniref:Uncharacterized protein n=1 Tax=Acrobeloides nanus TaxID=290746 RepID=A0A914DG19_9BILA
MEKLVYNQCESAAKTPVALAKCLVTLMNARDNKFVISESLDPEPAFWDKYASFLFPKSYPEPEKSSHKLNITFSAKKKLLYPVKENYDDYQDENLAYEKDFYEKSYFEKRIKKLHIQDVRGSKE